MSEATKGVLLVILATLMAVVMGAALYQIGHLVLKDDTRKQQQEHLCPLYRLHRGMV